MRKLTRADKKILIANQRHIEKDARSARVSIFKLWFWFHKINKAAKSMTSTLLQLKAISFTAMCMNTKSLMKMEN